MPHRCRILTALALLGVSAFGQTYYVATNGDDSYSGSFDFPFKTIGKAVSLAAQGTSILVRQGSYPLVSVIAISVSGAAGDTCRLLAYPGERAVLDCSQMPVEATNRGILLTGNYWHIRGFDVIRAGDNGMRITGSRNLIEYCTFSGNSDTGLQIDNGASYNLILNCDSYGNADPSQGNADGFAPKLGVGTGNVFRGCRAWQNSDDGWDGYLRGADDVTTILEDCWCFQNGYLSNGSPSNGNGNGFKLGGSDTANLAHNMILRRCLAFDNRVKGFDQNHNRGSMTLLNCTAYRNGTNYSIPEALRTSKSATLVNCIAHGFTGSLGGFVLQATNSWSAPFLVTDGDFLSTDTLGVRGSRAADGSLPDLPFMHLAQGSDLIDGGTDIGLPFFGSAPDLGAFETLPTSGVAGGTAVPMSPSLLQNFPNPFNPGTTIPFSLPQEADIILSVFDALGREVAVLANGRMGAGTHLLSFDGSRIPSGVYFYRMMTRTASGLSGRFSQTRSFILLK
jgi:hypothetical protein